MRMQRHKENGNYASSSRRSGGGSGGHAGLILFVAALVALFFAMIDEWAKKRHKKMNEAKRLKSDDEIMKAKIDAATKSNERKGL